MQPSSASLVKTGGGYICGETASADRVYIDVNFVNEVWVHRPKNDLDLSDDVP